MNQSRQLREQLIAIAHAIHERGWVANHDGNLTVRRGVDRILATPTAISKAAVNHENLIEVDSRGRQMSGTGRPFSELNLHLAVYERRDDVGGVIHAHPPYATAIACSGSRLIERPFIAEVVVSLGDWIPTVRFAQPGPDARRALLGCVDEVDVALLAGHGVISWGRDLETAYLRMELVEHHARIATLAQASGGVRPLPDDAIAPLLAARARAGLGKAAEHAGQRAPRAAARATPEAGARAPESIREIVREELLRALHREV